MAPRNSNNKFKSPGGDVRGPSKNKFKPDKDSFKNKQFEKRQGQGKSPQSFGGGGKFNGKPGHQNGKSPQNGKPQFGGKNQGGKSPKGGQKPWNQTPKGKPQFVKGQKAEPILPKQQKRPQTPKQQKKAGGKDVKKARVEDFTPKVQQLNAGKAGKKGKAAPVQSDSDEEEDEDFSDDEEVSPPKSAAKSKAQQKTPQPKAAAKQTPKAGKKAPLAMEVDSEKDDEELSDEEADFEDELDAFSDFEDSEEDDEDEEEENSPPAKEVKKKEAPKKAEPEPKKAAEAPKAEKKTKAAAAAETPARKRPAGEALEGAASKKHKVLSEVDAELVNEHNRRRVERDNRCIFLSLAHKKANRISDSAIKALHPDILTVCRLKRSAFLIFLSEAVRDKAFKSIQKAQLKGKPVSADLAGDKGKKHYAPPEADHTSIDLKTLVITDFPTGTTQNTLEIIFPKADKIDINRKNQMAFLTFGTEQDANDAFKKGKALKVNSVPVLVRYRVFTKGVQGDESPKKALNAEVLKPAGDAKKTPAAKANGDAEKKAAKKQAVEESSDEDEELDDEEMSGAEDAEDFAGLEFETEDEEEDDDERGGMTFFHFANCAVLAFAPYVLCYKYSPLSEYSSIWQCSQVAGIYFATQFVKLLTYATFFPAPESFTPSTFQYFLMNVGDLYDVVGMWLAISWIYGRGEIRFLVTGFSWAFAHSLATHLLPLLLGARKSAFQWGYVQRGLESNLELPFFVGVAALVWLTKSTKRQEASGLSPNRLAAFLLLFALCRNPAFSILEHVYEFHSWRLLAMKAIFSLLIAATTLSTYSQQVHSSAATQHTKSS
ncbi:hypothetical protein M3Y99_00851800 [Aphelenchoides fujianensis]|nr:hypothetical protein M3Y99_00851800 [Aphelenchoides fujianensis]